MTQSTTDDDLEKLYFDDDTAPSSSKKISVNYRNEIEEMQEKRNKLEIDLLRSMERSIAQDKKTDRMEARLAMLEKNKAYY